MYSYIHITAHINNISQYIEPNIVWMNYTDSPTRIFSKGGAHASPSVNYLVKNEFLGSPGHGNRINQILWHLGLRKPGKLSHRKTPREC